MGRRAEKHKELVRREKNNKNWTKLCQKSEQGWKSLQRFFPTAYHKKAIYYRGV